VHSAAYNNLEMVDAKTLAPFFFFSNQRRLVSRWHHAQTSWEMNRGFEVAVKGV
jgi:hypothetical protein